MTIETARRASLELVCVFGQDASPNGFTTSMVNRSVAAIAPQ